jgi:uroporphyrinogen-III synthase
MNGSEERPLRGACVVVTRPARQAAGLVQQIAVLGGKPLVFPTIVILPPQDRSALDLAQRHLAQYDFAVFVSANAVEYGVGDPAAWPANLVALAPGPSTAAALAAVGIGKIRIPATSMDSEGLLALPELADMRQKRVVIYRGGGGRELLGDALAGRGATVDYVDCYRREKPHGDFAALAAAWRSGEVDALTLTSSEGLDNLWELFDDASRRSIIGTPAFVPHPRVADRARELGFRRVIVSAPTDAGLLASLIEYFARPPT